MRQLIKNCKSLFRTIKNGGGRREYYELKMPWNLVTIQK